MKFKSIERRSPFFEFVHPVAETRLWDKNKVLAVDAHELSAQEKKKVASALTKKSFKLRVGGTRQAARDTQANART